MILIFDLTLHINNVYLCGCLSAGHLINNFLGNVFRSHGLCKAIHELSILIVEVSNDGMINKIVSIFGFVCLANVHSVLFGHLLNLRWRSCQKDVVRMEIFRIDLESGQGISSRIHRHKDWNNFGCHFWV
jgi:hypothetical protein